MEERRRSARVPKPVVKKEDVELADEAINEALKRKRGKSKVDENESKPKRKRTSSSSEATEEATTSTRASTKVRKREEKKLKREAEETEDCKLIGDEIPYEEAKERWPLRYDAELLEKKLAEMRRKRSDEELLIIKSHYSSAEVDGVVYHLNENAFVKSNADVQYICKIVEFFKTKEGHVYFTAQWYYRASDTVIDKDDQKHSTSIDARRIFFSDINDDNPLECLVGKPNISVIVDNIDKETKKAIISSSEFFCDMFYKLPYNTFIGIPPLYTTDKSNEASTSSCTLDQSSKSELSLLDLYAGCGAMSTGLCLGAKVGDVKLVTRWALDLNTSACDSLSLNHRETKVYNDCGENFLSLLKEWEKLCHRHILDGTSSENGEADSLDTAVSQMDVPKGEYEVEEIVDISYGNPKDLEKAKKSTGKGSKKNVEIPKGTELFFKVHWKGYASSEDTWEALSSLSSCEDIIRKFVKAGYQKKILPLPGDVDVICGGPPCQGISGHNHFRDAENPLNGEKNYQMVVYFDIIKFLQPKYILMENVVDLLQFSQGFLARYAMSRLISMDYQVRLGIVAAGSFGLPQFRQRVFLWGAQLGKKLPPYALPTHEAVVKYGVPNDFLRCLVAHDEIEEHNVAKPLYLGHALPDLPMVTNDETRDIIPYEPRDYVPNEFLQYIRLNDTFNGQVKELYDHLPLKLNIDDYQRVCRVPKKKGACFVDFGGVIIGENGEWELDSNEDRELLPSGNPLVPDYALSFNHGKSRKPFGRLWWDETVSTVVTRAEPHNQVITHPEQDRVLTVRENARLQGFFDHYKLCGDVRDKYTQVGNAVAVPVGKALGYALALAVRGLCDDEPVVKLPPGFAYAVSPLPPVVVDQEPVQPPVADQEPVPPAVVEQDEAHE